MDHVLALGPAEFAHAVRRFRSYANSPSAIARHHRRRGEHACERVCRRLHELERRLGIDLGALCARFAAREEPHVSAFERAVLDCLAEWGRSTPSGPVLLVRVDRVRTLNALVERRWLELRDGILRAARAAEGRADPV
jgi:hypothetical protein